MTYKIEVRERYLYFFYKWVTVKETLAHDIALGFLEAKEKELIREGYTRWKR